MVEHPKSSTVTDEETALGDDYAAKSQQCYSCSFKYIRTLFGLLVLVIYQLFFSTTNVNHLMQLIRTKKNFDTTLAHEQQPYPTKNISSSVRSYPLMVIKEKQTETIQLPVIATTQPKQETSNRPMVAVKEKQETILPLTAKPPPKEENVTGPIPHNLIFTYKTNILETKEPLQFYNNVMNTIQAYRKEWNEPNAPVYFLTDDNCTDLLKQVDQLENTTLLKAFEEYAKINFGDMKADICRVGAIYMYGGYYFDIDIEVMQPLRINSSISFSSVDDAMDGFFFQAFMAATRRHPVIQKNVHTIMDKYFKNKGMCNKTAFLGPCTLKEAWLYMSGRESFSRNLKEIHLSSGLYPNIMERPEGYDCNYVVHDPVEHQIYFFSRIIGSRYCKAINTTTPSPMSSPHHTT